MSGQGGLEARVAAVRRHLEAHTWQAVALWCGAAAVLVLVAAWLLAGSEGWRQGSNVPLVLDLGLLAAVLATGGWAWRGRRRWFAEVPLSRAMEDAAGLEAGTVRGSLELARAVPPGVSRTLAGRAEASALRDLTGSDRELAGSLGHRVRRWTRRGLGALTALAVVALGLAVAAPGRTASAWTGLTRPVGLAADPVLPPIEVLPGSVEVDRGADVEVRISAPGRSGARVDWQAAGDVARTAGVALESGGGVHRFRAVNAPLEYRVRTPDGAEAGPFRVVPVDPLFLSDLRVEVLYPEHTGLQAEEFRGEVPPLTLPAGSRLRVEGRASRPLGRAALERLPEVAVETGEEAEPGETAVSFSREGPSFAGTWTPRASGRYAWSVRDRSGELAEVRPEPLELTVQADRAPTVEIPVPGVDTLLPLDLRQPLVLEARDDYGLRRLELVARRITASGEAREPVTRALELGGTRAALARPVLDLRSWALMPGDTVRYFARVSDNSPAGQSGRSREFVLLMPDAAAMRRAAEEEIGSVGERLEELAREAGERAEEARDMEREARGAPRETPSPSPGRPSPPEGLGFEEREELRRAMEGQEELTSQVDSLRRELGELERTMEDAGQADPELRAELEELQELLREVADEELRERMRRLSEELEQERVPDTRRSMEEMARQQEELRERLEESLERFRRAAVEQDFRATRNEAEELARRQEALADAMEEGDDPALRAEQQEGLEERAEELEGRMERLQERLEQLGEEDAAQGVEGAREEAEQARREMAEAGEQAREEAGRAPGEEAPADSSSPPRRQPPQEGSPQPSQQSREGSPEAREAAQAMRQAAEQLDQAQGQMAQQQAEAARRALRRAADDALSLARRQAEIKAAMEGAGREELAAMRPDQASLLQGVRNMAANVQEAAEGPLPSSRELSTQMGRAMGALERTVESMGARRGSMPAPAAAADQAVGQLNQLALMALAGAEQMSQQQQGQGASSPEQMSQQLQQLAQEQGQVNNQSSQLTPMQLGEQAMSEQLQRLSEEQQSVADRIEELSEEPGSREASLGDLEELAREAEALAREMAQGRSPRELERRQEQLFRRLLDSGRSLERDEVSEERESTAAGGFERGEVTPLSEEALGALRYRIPDPERLQRLPPAVRQLVLQYFERLNRDAEPGGGER